MNQRTSVTFDGIQYAPGKQFRVIAEGLTLSGMTPMPGGARGWSQKLEPGDILTCTGYGAGWGSDPGYGVEFTSEQSEAARAFCCDVFPHDGGLWDYRPPAGSVVPV